MTPPSKIRVNEEGFRSYELTQLDDVIPLQCRGKRPRDKNWTHRNYRPDSVISDCVAADRNMGIRLGGSVMALDFDPRNGGEVSRAALAHDTGIDYSEFHHVRTGGGGDHYFMSKPEGLAIVGSLEKYPGLDIKTKGGQVVAVGSVHPDTGLLYEWGKGSPVLGEVPLREAPPSLLKLIARPVRAATVEIGGHYSREQLACGLDVLKPEDYRDQKKWQDFMMACHHATGGEGRDEFVSWSTRDPSYEHAADEIIARWHSCDAERTDGITYRTLEAALIEVGAQRLLVPGNASADFGDAPPIEPRDLEEANTDTKSVLSGKRGLKVNGNSVAADTIKNAIIAVRRAKLEVAYNEMKQAVEIRCKELPWKEGFGRVLDDNLCRIIRMHLIAINERNDFQPSKDNVYEALAGVAYGAKFNPVLDYLDSLKWDGIARVESLFSKYFSCGDDDYTRAVSRCFMVGAVGRMRRPGIKFDTMPVIKGPQGWNKSSGVKALVGQDWFSDADLGDLRNKDAALKLNGVWVQEIAEMDSFKRSEVGTLKAFLSRAVDRQRAPYDRLPKTTPRRNVFIGTLNEGGYLQDGTGARRFWPLEINKPVDLTALAEDRDQLWAEAAAMEAAGESNVLPPQLWPVAAKRQSAQTTSDPWADTIKSFLADRAQEYAEYFDNDMDEPQLPPDRVHTSELFDALSIAPHARTKGLAQRLRVVMENAIGWQHSETVRVLKRTGAGYRPKP